MTPAVSVIVPTYNRASLIGNTITALLNAGVPNLEVVIVDDGSKDNTEEVVRAFGGPVVYVRQQNAGPARARNLGFERSHGRYVLFLDDDDGWHHGTVAALAAALDAHADLPCIFGDTSMGSPEDGYVSFVDTYGGQPFHNLSGKRLAPDVKVLERWPFFRVLSQRNVMFLGSLLLRRSTFEQVGGFDEQLRGAADWEFFMRVAATHDVAFKEGGPISIYLKHSTGMSTDTEHMNADFAKALIGTLAKCDFPTDVRQHLQDKLRKQQFGFAYWQFDRGNMKAARRLFGEMLPTRQFRAREAVFWALTWAPSSPLRIARDLRRRLSVGADSHSA